MLIRRILLYAGYRTEPSFLIIGAQKAGTTALFEYLAQHPRIVRPSEKEIRFFTPEWYVAWPEHPDHKILCSGSADPLASRKKRA